MDPGCRVGFIHRRMNATNLKEALCQGPSWINIPPLHKARSVYNHFSSELPSSQASRSPQSHFNGLKTPCAEHLQLQTPNTTITKTIDTGSLNPRIPQTPTLHALAPCITAAVHALDFATCPAVSKRAIGSQPLHAMLGVLLRPTGPSGQPATRRNLPKL